MLADMEGGSEDELDDLMDELGFGNTSKPPPKKDPIRESNQYE